MINLNEVKVTATLLLEWEKLTNKDPLAPSSITLKDIVKAYFVMAKSLDSSITEAQAAQDIESKDVMKIARHFFPGLAIPKEDLENIPSTPNQS